MVSKPPKDNSKQGENRAEKYFAHGLVFMFGILIGAAIYIIGVIVVIVIVLKVLHVF